MPESDLGGQQDTPPSDQAARATPRTGNGAITCGLLVVLAVLAGVLFVVGAQTQGTILAIVGVILTGFGVVAALVLTPDDKRRMLQIANNLLIIFTIIGLAFLGYKAVAYNYRSLTVTSDVRLPQQQLGPGDSVPLRTEIPSPRRYITITFGWKDANPELGGCGVDAELTFFGHYGYPRSPIKMHGIKDAIKIDLGSARKSAEVQVRLDSADSRCLGTLYVKYAKAHR
ncbi:hypothetical protein [Actinomadura rugatobispora]|uniref:DUF4190 domain-containing protein n=1 Tax=Actinomadura rugatobispora TaxID=1994 RepID=A0ABW0ZSZ5_9ACTN|nr:hypothetical protein GCM10010200_027830 [Actinomadura rugatobispora]